MMMSRRLLVCLPLAFALSCLGCGSPPNEEMPAIPPAEATVESSQEAAAPKGTAIEPAPSVEPAPVVSEPPESPGEPVETVQVAELPEDAVAVAQLAAEISGDNQVLRQAAIAQVEARGQEGLRQMRDLLGHTQTEVRRSTALFLLDRFDPSDAEMRAAIIQAASDQDPLVRSLALSAIRRFGSGFDQPVVVALAARLDPQQEESTNRASAARLLGALESDSEATIRRASEALAGAVKTDPDRSVRSAALMSLARIGTPAMVNEVCRAALRDDAEASVRGLAASRLARLGAEAAPSAAALAAAMEDGDEAVRSKAAEALVGMGAQSLPLLTAKLKSPNAEVRKLAIYSMIALGAAAKPAETSLTECLQDPDAQVRELAQMAIRRLRNY